MFEARIPEKPISVNLDTETLQIRCGCVLSVKYDDPNCRCTCFLTSRSMVLCVCANDFVTCGPSFCSNGACEVCRQRPNTEPVFCRVSSSVLERQSVQKMEDLHFPRDMKAENKSTQELWRISQGSIVATRLGGPRCQTALGSFH